MEVRAAVVVLFRQLNFRLESTAQTQITIADTRRMALMQPAITGASRKPEGEFEEAKEIS
jgi:hypothetical protein